MGIIECHSRISIILYQWMKTAIPRVNIAWYDLKTPTSLSDRLLDGARGLPPHPRRMGTIFGTKILPYIYNFDKPGTKTVILRVDTAAHSVRAQTALVLSLINGGSRSQRRPATTVRQSRILATCIHLQFRRTGRVNSDPPD